MFVWIAPVLILAYKLFTFPTTDSVLDQTNGGPALHYFFGREFSIPEFHSWKQFWEMTAAAADTRRGMDQLAFVAPLYVSVAYAFAAQMSAKLNFIERVRAAIKRF